jgi:hypothetical protein
MFELRILLEHEQYRPGPLSWPRLMFSRSQRILVLPCSSRAFCLYSSVRDRRSLGFQISIFLLGPFTGGEHPPGTPTPSLPFLLCETEHPNPSYL